MEYPEKFKKRFKHVYPYEEGIYALIEAGEMTCVGVFLEEGVNNAIDKLIGNIYEDDLKRDLHSKAVKLEQRWELYKLWNHYKRSPTLKIKR